MQRYWLDILLYSASGGDFIQLDFIERSMTLADLHKWLGISHYLSEKEKERMKKGHA